MEPTETPIRAPETKIMETYEAFRQANDESLAEGQRKSAPDILLEEKVERIGRELDRLSLNAQRPPLAGAGGAISPERLEHKRAFDAYLRKGQNEPLRLIEAKALNGAIGPDAGYLVPPDIEAAVLSRMAGLSPIRGIASVRSLAGSSLKKAVSPEGAHQGWASLGAPSSAITPGLYAELGFQTMELFAQPAATQAMLDDAAVDVESWIGEEIELTFASAESEAFVKGDGVSRPRGFLSYPQVPDAQWSWGQIGTVATGAAGAFPAANPSDILIELAHSVRSVYRQNACFVMNRRTQSMIRRFKDTTGNYIWAPPTLLGGKATILNFPVIEAEAMPDIAANSTAIAFGDFRRGYLVLDRVGIRALRDPYSAKPYVLFYTTKRVGGGMQDFRAIKLLRFGV
ncbi:MAG: phage major capsid protein [Beijerinckiaceae bacterium]|nr:phage major capsid protein [Beijerinckiaceae bacterium]